MRFIIILIFIVSSIVSRSCPCDTVNYIFLPKLSIESHAYSPKIAYIYKQEYGGYQITFVLPDVYYWPRNPDMIIKLIDFDTGITISSDILQSVDKGQCAFVKPGHYLMIIFVISHSQISFFKDDFCYIVELSRN